MVHDLTNWLLSLAISMPIVPFTFLGSFIEEVIAPIPSPIVLTLAGTMAAAQQWPWTSLFWLALVGASGKTVGAVILYVISDRAENFVLTRFGHFLGLTHNTVEKIGEALQRGKKDIWILFLLRATPVVPSAPLSVLCGVLKVRFIPFMIVTFIGSVIRDLAFLALGYTGIEAGHALIEGVEKTESILTIVIAAAIVAFLAWCYMKRRQWLGR